MGEYLWKLLRLGSERWIEDPECALDTYPFFLQQARVWCELFVDSYKVLRLSEGSGS